MSPGPPMGTFRVEIEVGDPGARRFERIDALVDTGATYTTALLGAYALEGLRLAADPVARRLVPVPGLLLAAEACSLT
jgi:hypothetical protein